MSRIPDCRTDEYYNEKYLKEADKNQIEGYDWAVEECLDGFFDNLNTFDGLDDILSDNKAVIMEGKADLLKEAIKEWFEMERDELITSMLDSYDENEYKAIKKAVDAGSEESPDEE